jgi:hypothetical protein
MRKELSGRENKVNQNLPKIVTQRKKCPLPIFVGGS